MEIGIYGGSFDPIHTGHAMVANFVAQCNVVDEVWIMVSRRNPLKANDTYATDSQRFEMVSLVAEKCRNVKASREELSLPYPSYTYDTLKYLQKKYPGHTFSLIIGSDSLERLSEWKNSRDLQREFRIIVYPRPGYPFPELEPDNMTFLNGAPTFGISSSLVREYVKSDWDINYFVPASVSDYIKLHKLYR